MSTLARVTGFHDTHEPAAAAAHPLRARLLVARTHAYGLARLREQLNAPSHPVVRVVLVPDAPGEYLPKPLRDQARILSGVIGLSLAPWVPSWRYAPGEEITPAVTGFLTLLHEQLTGHLTPAPSGVGPHINTSIEGAA